jgi:pimeloyl-ACP methyl ester carboxylesterase
MVCVHGFTGTWRMWSLVLEALERHHEVLAPTLAGHAGGPALAPDAPHEALIDELERAMDDAGFETAHIVGNSLGGYAALKLAERGRARTVVALAPAGGWAPGDETFKETLSFFTAMRGPLQAVLPYVAQIVERKEGRRQATEMLAERYEHIPADVVADLIAGAANCTGLEQLIEQALAYGWPLEPELVTCPVRIVWGVEDRLLKWPSAAARYRASFPTADWIELEGVGHCPQLDVPLETAQLILGFTAEAQREAPGRVSL